MADQFMTTDEKKIKLEKLKQELESRKDISLISRPEDVVFGYGNPDTEVLFIGEAAGYWETVERKPFVGQAGKLLTKTLNEIGIDRENVYITNVIKARPPDNRDPLPEEIEAFRPYLDKEIEIISPRIVVTLGRFSMAKFIPGVTISQVHGVARYYQPSTMNYKLIIFPMYHPAAALRGTSILNAFKEDFTKLKNFLGSKMPVVEEVKKEDNSPSQPSLF